MRLAFSDSRFTILLGFMALFLIALPVLPLFSSRVGQHYVGVFTRLLFVAVLVAAVFAAARHNKSALIASALAVPAVALQLVRLFHEEGGAFIAGHVFGIALLLYVVLVTLKAIFETNIVTIDTISASICVYFILGIMWSLVYSLLEIAQPGSFMLSTASEVNAETMRFSGAQSEFPIYYSFVTITTLGYGDVLPAKPTCHVCR